MRIWSIHPKYLDPQGLVALWREALLAQKVLAGKTKGYRNHPQLKRFKLEAKTMACIGTYLKFVYLEAESRGYSFDYKKIIETLPTNSQKKMRVTCGQVEYEFEHLKMKLKKRSPDYFKKTKVGEEIELHPLFSSCPGAVESWEII